MNREPDNPLDKYTESELKAEIDRRNSERIIDTVLALNELTTAEAISAVESCLHDLKVRR